MKPIYIKQYSSLALHILGWSLLGFLILLYGPLTWHVIIPQSFWIKQILLITCMITLFYINSEIIVPKTLLKNNTPSFVVWIISVCLAIQLLMYIYNDVTKMPDEMAVVLGNKTFEKNIFFNGFILTITLLVLGISTSMTMLQNWQQTANLRQKFEQEKIAAELEMLKTQINPHFFFNTLNNIYSLTYIDIEASRVALHKLSRMMRYLLYGTENNETTLLKEIDFLNDYISLMQLRINEKQKLIINFTKNLHDYPIAPMIFLPFIENAFKYGINATESSEINISIKQQDNNINFIVINDVFNSAYQSLEVGGIGVANTKRRLELLYPNTHTLSVGINQDGKFYANLSINL